MAEVLARYFERERGDMPDMVLLDGGKGQLRAVERVRDSAGLVVPLVAIAKGRKGGHDHFYIVGRANPIRLAAGSSEYNFLQRIRDEAHRFAIEYHRRLRKSAGLASVLDEIDGIGPKRKRALLERFGTVEGIRGAAVEAIVAAGVPPRIAGVLKSAIEGLSSGRGD